MANVTLTNQTANFDETPVLGLLNGETITLNNSTLNVDSDVRWGQNAAVIGAMTVSATLGGNINLDGTKTWWIPYDAPTGNVPALGTWNVQNCTGGTSGATGEFLGIFTALGVAPTASGAAIPATGFIKFRSKVGNFVDNEVITLPGGATITVNSTTGGQRGWIHVVGTEAQTITLPRLGRFQIRGDWFQLGVTNGADDQTFQFPVLDNCPAIQVETAAGSGVYEWWLNAGSRWGTATAFISQDARGKYFGMDNTTGVITIARRASNACGFKPPTGCLVRIPNVILSSSTSANYALNTINATLATRYDFTTTGAGDVDIEFASCNWYLSLTNPFQVKISNSSILQSILVSNTAGTTDITNSALGLNSTTEVSPVTFSNLFSGGTIDGFRAVRYASSATGQFCLSMTDCVDFTINNSQFEIFGGTAAVTRGNATVYTALLTRVNNTTFNTTAFIGSRNDLVTCSDVTYNNCTYADAHIGSTTTTNPQSFIVIGSGSNRLTVNGFSNFASITNVNPKSFIVSAGNTFGITILNIGSPTARYNGGAATFQLRSVLNATVCTDILIRRCYFSNLENTTGFIFLTNTCQRVEITNLWADADDLTPIAGLAVRTRGVFGNFSVAVQTAVYGSHIVDGFNSTTAGFLNFLANEPLTSTTAECSITAGTPKFTSSGGIVMPTVGDQITWETPYFVLGHTSLANALPTVTGATTTNMTYQYQIDTGSGFGTLKTANGANLSSETISPTTGFKFRLIATTATAATTNRIDFVRITTVTNSTDQQTQYPLPKLQLAQVSGIAFNSRIQVYNVTTATEIANEIVPGSTWSLPYNNGDEFDVGDQVRIRLTYQIGTTAFLGQEIAAIVSSTGFSALASQQNDTVYNDIATDGSTITEFTPDYINNRIDLNSGLNWLGADFYPKYVNILYSANGIRNFFGAITAIDGANFRINSSIIDLNFNNTTSTNVYQNDNIRIFREDGAYPVINPTTGGGGIDLNWRNVVYLAEVGTSGLTAGEAATLAKLDTLTETAGSPSGLRFTAKALETAGGGGLTASAIADAVWDEALSGHLTAGSTGAALNGANAPSAATVASAVRTELTTELARIDVSTSSRLASASYTTPPTVTAIRTEMDTNSTKLDVAVGTRLATAGYTAPANSDIAAIKVKTDNLPASPASSTNVSDAQTAIIAEVNANEAKIDIIDTNVDAVKAKTDTLVNTDLSTVAKTSELVVVNNNVKKASKLIPAGEDI